MKTFKSIALFIVLICLCRFDAGAVNAQTQNKPKLQCSTSQNWIDADQDFC